MATANEEKHPATELKQEEKVGSSQTEAESLKNQGNLLFVNGQYEEAEKLYSAAIELDPSIHVLYGNRSAAICHQERFDEALVDAMRALELDPTWVKGYHRKAAALSGLGKYREAVLCYEEALAVEPQNKFLKTQVKKAVKMVTKTDTQLPVTSLEHWLKVFSNIQDNMRLRLATLATFWNLCAPTERHTIFTRFLVVVAGDVPAPVSGEDFLVDQMVELPMHNYVDIEVPVVWTEFFAVAPPQLKLETFEASYRATSEEEKTHIIHDLRHFFIPAAEIPPPRVSNGKQRKKKNGKDGGKKAVAAITNG